MRDASVWMESTSIEIKENVLQEDHILADNNLPVQKGPGEGDLKSAHLRGLIYLIIGLSVEHSSGGAIN